MRFLCLILFSLVNYFNIKANDLNTVIDSTLPSLHRCMLHGVEPPKAVLTDYDIVHYDFDLNMERNSRDISGVVTITAKAIKDNFDSFEFQLHDNYTIDSILLGNQKVVLLSPSKHRKMAYFATPIAKNQLFKVSIFYKGKAPLSSNNWGNGIVQKKDSKYNAEVMYSLSVPYHALEWFPSKQVLSDLVDSVTMRITTDFENTVISNGLQISDIPKVNNKHSVTWKTYYPINFYLISFAIGKYTPYHFDVKLPNKVEKMPVMNYVYNSTALTKQKPILDKLGDFLTNYSNLFGLYPFSNEKFGTVEVPLSGGMEHQTIVNLATDYDKYLAAHEMAHQWWGDNVNVNSYHDVWLNEGWATYCEYLTAEKIYASEARGILDNFHTSGLSQAESRVYIADTTDFTTIYNFNNVYMKGAAIIHTLRYEIGNDSLFFAALTKYQLKFKNKSVTALDLKQTLEKETGKDLTLFFDQWYYGYGYPKFSITWANKEDKLYIKSLQNTSSLKTPLFKTNVEFLVKRENKADTIITVNQSVNEQSYIVGGLSNVKSISLDPRNVILNKLTSLKQDQNLISVNNVIPESSIQVFPNPAKSVINIHTELLGNWFVEVFDAKGNKVLNTESHNFNKQINVNELTSGSYFLKITSSDAKIWSKIISIIH